jgi:hypothetical protein
MDESRVKKWMKYMLLSKALLWFSSSVFLCQVANAEPDQPHGTLSGDSCNSITGLYQVAGEYLSTPSLYAKARMDWVLFLREVGGKPTGIELNWNGLDGVMVVRILGVNLFPPETVSYSIKASCMGGKITYEVKHEGRSEGGTKNKAHMKAQLSKDSVGNLIINGQMYVESTDLLVFRRTQESEINARFFPSKINWF